MSDDLKEKLFTKKNYIIVAIILALIIGLIIIFASQKSKKTLKCDFAIQDIQGFMISVSMDVEHSKYVDKIYGKIEYQITDSIFASKIDKLEEAIRTSLSENFSADGVDYSIKSSGSSIFVDYTIDYNKYTGNTLPMLYSDEVENFNRLTVDTFKKSIKNVGGKCYEE